MRCLFKSVGYTPADYRVRVFNEVVYAPINNWGGQNVYFPMGMVWKVSQRDREIFLEFDGRNHHELARKFGVSLQWIYSVVKRVRKEELDRMQGKLFEEGAPDDEG